MSLEDDKLFESIKRQVKEHSLREDRPFALKIIAIKAHREITGSDLMTAKCWVEANPKVFSVN